VPVFVTQGLKDNVVSVATAPILYAALTGTTSKTLLQVGCASHVLFWEGCTGPSCNSWRGPHETMRKNIGDWINTGMIYASPGSTNGAFISTPQDGTNQHTKTPILDGPPADESNEMP
jgi:hypothetical protein